MVRGILCDSIRTWLAVVATNLKMLLLGTLCEMQRGESAGDGALSTKPSDVDAEDEPARSRTNE